MPTAAFRALVSILLAVLAVALGACGEPPPRHDARFLAMGTLVEVTLYGVSQDRARSLTEELRNRFETWNRHWHPWRGDGLARLNRALATNRPATVSTQLAGMLRLARDIEARSGDRFDPAIGGLIRLWGFSQDDHDPTHPPPADEIQALVRQQPRLSDLEISGRRVSSDKPGLQIDLGGFAKGYAVGRALDFLQARDVKNAIVDAGGDLAAIGRPGDRLWRIGVRAPRGEGLLATIDIDGGEAIFTSGDYERYFIYKGRRFHHIIDPATGYPARGTESVTIINRKPALADAAATALFVAGPKDWPAVARKLGIHYVMLVDDQGTVHMNPAMAKRIRFVGKPPPVERSAPL